MESEEQACSPWPHLLLDQDPYAALTVLDFGMTGYIKRLSADRVVKVAKQYPLEEDGEPWDYSIEYINGLNREALVNEVKVYRRLGRHVGIVSCFQTSNFGVELALARQGDLETYIGTQKEVSTQVKAEWILSLVDTMAYIHTRKVLVDEIALRNILVDDGKLKFADFGQSVLLPLATDMDTVSENDLTAKIEILHVGWIIYSIVVWRVVKFYFFNAENDMQWPASKDLPRLDDVFCGVIVEKCWKGHYKNMECLREDAYSLLKRLAHGHDTW